MWENVLDINTAKKWCFPLRISLVNVTFTEEILNGKLYFLCSVINAALISLLLFLTNSPVAFLLDLNKFLPVRMCEHLKSNITWILFIFSFHFFTFFVSHIKSCTYDPDSLFYRVFFLFLLISGTVFWAPIGF